ncbi:hypothetical protein [Acaricomes phytoseiuli]|uniref:hypothetical protein n=1 Tax=Acaricomes phytoseiuli TaxID=291968 RepID=UPI001FDF7A7A|nr:hypothetical protein [Acaricomes phytoseiuli]
MTTENDHLKSAAYWVMAPAAVSKILSGLEALSASNQYRSDGILQGRSASKPNKILPKRIRTSLDTWQGAAALQVLSISGGVLVLSGFANRPRQTLGATMMFLSNKLSELRNPYGSDGADQMSEVISGYRIITAFVPNKTHSDDLFLRAVNAQVCISYAASGLAKLISSSWRSGVAVEKVLRTDLYGRSKLAGFLRNHPRLSKTLSWSTIAWETTFPLIYLATPVQARRILLAIKAFHLGIAMTMGLPRFFWAFSSAHAAVIYAIESKQTKK